jgi:hypothetical protein
MTGGGTMSSSEHSTQPEAQPQHGDIVTIMVDNKACSIHRGHRTVAEIKAAAGVPAAFQLDQLIDGTFTPLADDGAVTIKGDEVFMSFPKGGQFS